MTAVIIESTGEVVEMMSRVEAERVTQRIADKLDAIADNYEQVVPLISDALTREAWRALGYKSVQAYVSERFAGAFGRLPREVRRPVVQELSALGMSTRAIAPIVESSHMTVQNDLSSSGVKSFTPEPADEPAPLDRQAKSDLVRDALRSAEQTGNVVQLTGPAIPKPVTGLDGKTYSKPSTPTEPRRKPLTDQFFTAAYDMGKAIERVHRLIGDDRYPQNAEKVAAKHRNDLLRSQDLLQQVIDSLPTQGV